MNKSYKERLKDIDKKYIDPTGEMIQNLVKTAGKRLVIKPIVQIMSEIVNAGIDAVYDVKINLGERKAQLKENVADIETRLKIKEGMRELTDIIIDMAIDSSKKMSQDALLDVYSRILVLDVMSKALNLPGENDLPERFKVLLEQLQPQQQLNTTKSKKSKIKEFELIDVSVKDNKDEQI